MTRFVIEHPHLEDVDEIQSVFCGPQTGEFLGGLIYLATIKDALERDCVLVCRESSSGKIVGASEVSLKGHFRTMLGPVATLLGYRRLRVATSLYFGQKMIGSLQGRLVFVDQIMSNNKVMPQLLLRLGFHRLVCLREKSRGALDMNYWVSYLGYEGLERHRQYVPDYFKFRFNDVFRSKAKLRYVQSDSELVSMGRRDEFVKLRDNVELSEQILEEGRQ